MTQNVIIASNRSNVLQQSLQERNQKGIIEGVESNYE